MSVTGKVWGTTECLLASPLIEVHRLSIKPMHQCSLHVHRAKWNAFYVMSGRLFVERVKDDYPRLTDVTELRPGAITTVPPGEHHRFRTGEQPCEALEIYYPEILGEDIERRGQGGPVDE